jgi:ferrous iron transport protein B
MENKELVLTSLYEGEQAFVVEIRGGRGLRVRLASMGLVPGAKIKVLRNRAGLLIVSSGGTRLAMGRGQADKILVRRAEPEKEAQEAETKREVLVALLGQPNVGKSTIFNIITGLSQHVGNWPGKTVERKEGTYCEEDVQIRIVDLPGTYAFSAFSEEERIARDFIIEEHPDVVVLVVNAASLERGLYLLSEVLLFRRPTILVLNMVDVAEAQGIHIDVEALKGILRIPVVPTVATKNIGIKELVREIVRVTKTDGGWRPDYPPVLADHTGVFEKITGLLREHIQPPYTEEYVTAKLMEGDPEVAKLAKDLLPVSVWNEIQSELLMHEDTLRAVVGGRYDWIEGIKRRVVSEFRRGELLITDRLDHVLTHPIFGIPLLICILGLIFFTTFKVGVPLQGILGTLLSLAQASLGSFMDHAPWVLRGLLLEGVLGGVGSVLALLPLLFTFFLAIAILEDVGYMARAAFVMDRLMHFIGLHGKSFLPLCLGIGCNVPSLLGSRIIESRRARLLTLFLTPFVPCTARLSLLVLVSTVLFQSRAMAVSLLCVSLNIVLLFLSGLVVRVFFLRGESVPLIMELPLFQRPNARSIAISIWMRISEFLKKAGTIIFLFSLLFWAFSHLPSGRIEGSLIYQLGCALEPVARFAGLDWRMTIALLSAFVAKENAIATLAILFGTGQEGLRDVLPATVSLPSGLAFLCMLMLFIPCVASTVVMAQEMGNKRWFLSSLLSMLFVSYLMGILVYQVSRGLLP